MTSVEATLTIETEKWKVRGTATIGQQHIMQLTEVTILKEQVTLEGNFITLEYTPAPTNADGKHIGHMRIETNGNV